MARKRMVGYLGQTRSYALISECTQPCEYPPRRMPWICDNGAWSMRAWPRVRVHKHWCANERNTFYHRVARGVRPTIVILPDIVAGGQESLMLSLRWLDWMAEHATVLAAQAYLPVQDGMTVRDVEPHLARLSGLFVGGSTAWKWRTARMWSRLAYGAGKRTHIGRVGTGRLVRLAQAAGADSIDSCVPLWSQANLRRWLRALSAP